MDNFEAWSKEKCVAIILVGVVVVPWTKEQTRTVRMREE